MNESTLVSSRPFNRDVIRYFALICMTLDHIAWWFFDFLTPAAQVMHFFGRITAPVMCFFIAEGFHYTKNLKRYFMRITIFAVISQLPFILMGQDELNMLFTLLFSLTAVTVYEKRDWNPLLRAIVIFAMIAACHFADWDIFGILWVLTFHIFREKPLKKVLCFIAVWLLYYFYAVYINVTSHGITGIRDNAAFSLYTTGSLFALIFVLGLYNGKKGRFASFSKWFVYIYYPTHLMVIWAIYSFQPR